MNDQTSSSKQGGSQLTTPLSVSFKDTAFMDFINEVNVRPQQAVKKPQKNNRHRSPASAATVATNTDSLTKPRVPSVADDNNNNTAGTGSAATADDNSMDCWDELDNIELDSQTMRDLVETEEQFFATQQMEFPEGLSQLESKKNPTTPNTKSAPATPATAVAAGTTVTSATRPVPHLHQQQQPQHQHQQQILRSKTNLLPRLTQHIPSTYHPPLPPNSITGRPVTRNNSADTSAAVDELAQLRSENERMRIEAQKIRDELYRAKGEVKIVRDNLANTEIDNTHLQERLANETARASGERQKVEEELKKKIESLETSLRFKEQEAQEAVFNNSVGSGGGNMQTQQQLTPMSAGNQKQQKTDEFASISLLPPTSNHHQQRQQHPTANTLIGTISNTEEELLKILSGISSASHVTGFGRLVSLSVLLIRATKETDTNGVVERFHSQVCSDLRELAEQNDDDSSYGQLDAMATLLKRVLGTMHQFVRSWLQQTPNRYANEFLAATACSIHMVMAKSSLSNSGGSAIASLCRLLIDIIGLCPVDLGDMCNPCAYVPLITSDLHVQGLVGLLELFTAMIQSPSLSIWKQHICGHLENYERLLLATMERLQAAYKCRDPFMLDGERALLMMVASSIVIHEADASRVINSMPRFAAAMVQWFLDEHQSLLLLQPQHRRDEQGRRRVQVFLEHIKCLHVILSEVEDVVALMGGDNSPMFFAYVAACTRMIVGESMLKWIENEETESVGELLADLLAYVVTEQQAMSIQNL